MGLCVSDDVAGSLEGVSGRQSLGVLSYWHFR